MLFSVFRDLESRDQRCTQCDQYERALAKLKKENQEREQHTVISKSLKTENNILLYLTL
jgi:hypothetical protein